MGGRVAAYPCGLGFFYFEETGLDLKFFCFQLHLKHQESDFSITGIHQSPFKSHFYYMPLLHTSCGDGKK